MTAQREGTPVSFVQFVALLLLVAYYSVRQVVGPIMTRRASLKVRRLIEQEEREREAWEAAVRLNEARRTCWCGAPAAPSHLCVTHRRVWSADA